MPRNQAHMPICAAVETEGKSMSSGIDVKTVVASLMIAATIRIFLREVMTVKMVSTDRMPRKRKPSEYIHLDSSLTLPSAADAESGTETLPAAEAESRSDSAEAPWNWMPDLEKQTKVAASSQTMSRPSKP